MNKKEIIILIGIIVLFIGLHIPGIKQLYHQDEYKWPLIVNPSLTEPGGIPHPPVGEFIYRQAGFLVGYDNFRLVPFFFGFLNLLLLFYLVKNIYDTRTALWSVGLFAASFYSLLASLMVDTDGAIMPFFFLVMCIGYFKLKRNTHPFTPSRKDGESEKAPLLRGGVWGGVLILGAIGGFFVKASFIIAIGALALDFAFEKNVFRDKRKILKYLGFAFGGVIALGLLLLLAKLIFPFFNLGSSLKYWKHFANSSSFFDRGWLQTFIQFVKAIMYTSPLLILPAFLVDKEIWQKTRPFFLFIFIGLVFYLFAFDFSIGALDRYFQFLVVPLCLIGGSVFAKNLFSDNSPPLASLGPSLITREGTAIGVITLLIFFSQFLDHFVPPLYPKTEWLNRIFGFEWNFFFPFTGGSGPTGFYVSFLFIILCWLASLILLRRQTLWAILIIGIMYNGVFVEEYLWGKINGNVTSLFREAKAVIAQDPNIKSVLVYNDIGGFEIQQTGKYKRRIYAAPQFEATYREIFTNFNGHILFIDIPRIGENNFYSNYLDSCKEIYKEKDKYITAKIFECNKLK